VSCSPILDIFEKLWQGRSVHSDGDSMKRFLPFMLLAAACSDTAPDSVELQQSLVQDVVQPAVISTAIENAAEKKAKAEWTGEVAPQVIDWTEAVKHTPIKDGLVPSAQKDIISGVSLPVLLPLDATLASSVFMTKGDLWYGADMNGEGVHVYMHGTRGSYPNDFKLSDEQLAQIQNFTIYRTHEIVTLTFKMYGAAYRVDVECAAPDARCKDDAYVTNLAENLVLAGGQQ
jgi:hypothetical protein